jgi:hypothetical protein
MGGNRPFAVRRLSAYLPGIVRNFVSIGGTGFQPVKKHGQDGRATWALTQKAVQSHCPVAAKGDLSYHH